MRGMNFHSRFSLTYNDLSLTYKLKQPTHDKDSCTPALGTLHFSIRTI